MGKTAQLNCKPLNYLALSYLIHLAWCLSCQQTFLWVSGLLVHSVTREVSNGWWHLHLTAFHCFQLATASHQTWVRVTH
jgi:hypothetical protein